MTTAWTFRNTPRSTVGGTCPLCRTIHCATDVVAVGRFNPDGATGYRPKAGGDIRSTRADAMADVCRGRMTTTPAVDTTRDTNATNHTEEIAS